MFGDFNFRCDTEGVVKKLTKDLSIHRTLNIKNDHTKMQYRDDVDSNILTIGKKEFLHAEHQTKFKESWVCENVYEKIEFSAVECTVHTCVLNTEHSPLSASAIRSRIRAIERNTSRISNHIPSNISLRRGANIATELHVN